MYRSIDGWIDEWFGFWCFKWYNGCCPDIQLIFIDFNGFIHPIFRKAPALLIVQKFINAYCALTWCDSIIKSCYLCFDCIHPLGGMFRFISNIFGAAKVWCSFKHIYLSKALFKELFGLSSSLNLSFANGKNELLVHIQVRFPRDGFIKWLVLAEFLSVNR